MVNTFSSAMLELVQRYVGRQKIVLDVIQQLRPDLLIPHYGVNWTKEKLDELVRIRQEVARIPQRGQWGENNEWQYFIHGRGCKLINTITGEPINWDAPNITQFDKFWFLEYLQWLFEKEPENPFVTILKSEFLNYNGDLREFTFVRLNQLYQHGDLSKVDSQNKYILLSI